MSAKSEQYALLRKQVESLTEGESDLTANLANVAAAIQQTFNFWWTGFYLVRGQQLVLGPFQGPVACTRIPFGRGVCGTAWQRRETVVVPDVEAFPGHIACSSASRSEIVVPILRNGEVLGVLDIDSRELATFDDEDAGAAARIVEADDFVFRGFDENVSHECRDVHRRQELAVVLVCRVEDALHDVAEELRAVELQGAHEERERPRHVAVLRVVVAVAYGLPLRFQLVASLEHERLLD